MAHDPAPIRPAPIRPAPAIRRFLASEAAGGVVLMGMAALAIVVANSPLAPGYFAALHGAIGPLSVGHWVNDGLMAVFFLCVGLEIKREMLEGQLASWPRRVLPGGAALGGMVVPALVYIAFNSHDPLALRGWAIPSATDIAFALGVLSLLGRRVPASLKVFLAALAIIDDLGAVVIIALFYTGALSLPHLAGAALVAGLLALLNRRGVQALWPYLLLGAGLWLLVLQSGVHATIAGVVLALAVPLRAGAASPLARLGWAALPEGAGWRHMLGTALLCGIGFTMSLFIGLLAFAEQPLLQTEVKFGILGGSLLAGALGALVLRLAPPAPRR